VYLVHGQLGNIIHNIILKLIVKSTLTKINLIISSRIMHFSDYLSNKITNHLISFCMWY